MDINKDHDFIKTHFTFFDQLSQQEQQLLLSGYTIQKYDALQNIYSAENECVGILIVKSGELRTYMLSDEGRDITLYRLFPGDICILSASCILKNITFDLFIDAEQTSEIVLVNASTFAKLASQNIYAENFSLRLAADRFSDVMWAMEQVLFMSFDRRLAIFLTDESTKTGTNTLHLTHEQIARYMGSAREVVSRMIKYFCSEGILEAHRGQITIIDRIKLKKLTFNTSL